MQVHLLITGFVQGVGYRHFVKRSAESFELTGWVKNLPDGRVEVLLQGTKESLEQAINEFWKGPFVADVDDIQVAFKDTETPFNDFSILF